MAIYEKPGFLWVDRLSMRVSDQHGVFGVFKLGRRLERYSNRRSGPLIHDDLSKLS